MFIMSKKQSLTIHGIWGNPETEKHCEKANPVKYGMKAID